MAERGKAFYPFVARGAVYHRGISADLPQEFRHFMAERDFPPRKRRGICRPPFSLKRKCAAAGGKEMYFVLDLGLDNPWSR